MRSHLLAVAFIFFSGSFLHFHAQQPRWDVGAAFQVGLRYSSTPRDDVNQLAGAGSLYGEWLSPPHLSFINVGLDLRADRGVLVGPRISTGGSGPWHAYGVGLFGPTQATYNPGTVVYPYGTTPPDMTRYGVTSEGAFGVEVDVSSHCRWRIFELTGASFSGIPDSYPFTLQTGVVLHLR
jgi:hypothetical protein